jgi:hypothetical protein
MRAHACRIGLGQLYAMAIHRRRGYARGHDAKDVPDFRSVFGTYIPDNGPSGKIDRTYAIEYDNVLVLALDTCVNAGRVNQAWVDAKLNANTLPHVFVFGHMPAFKAQEPGVPKYRTCASPKL